MRQLRQVISVTVNREYVGLFTTFQGAFNALREDGYEIKSYRMELRRFSKANEVRLLAVRRGSSWFTLFFRKEYVNCLKKSGF